MLINHKNLYIIGTSHISTQSLREVEGFIGTEKPEIIALELDRGRLNALLSGNKGKGNMLQYGIKGYVFAKAAHYVEHKLGARTGVKPGSEMILAYKLAQKNKLRVALIDQDIRVTLNRLNITWRERWRFVVDIFKGTFQYLFKRDSLPKFDLHTVPPEELIESLITQMKDRYPNIYNVLVEERNQYMAKKLFVLINEFPESKILAVVGAGHGREIVRIIKSMERV